ncbi:MAG: enoyl-CoA hydratase/isomerase family protein, partial [Polyangiaceae bacterium]
MTAAYERIKVARECGVETIALSNPRRKNAIGPRMTGELLRAMDAARASGDVHAIVLTGDGSAFCSGGDFAEIAGPGNAGEPEAPKGDFAELLLALCRSEKPVIAKVNGDALGGGVGLVAACTFAVASAGARLGTPEIKVGLFPMMIMAVLARHVP